MKSFGYAVLVDLQFLKWQIIQMSAVYWVSQTIVVIAIMVSILLLSATIFCMVDRSAMDPGSESVSQSANAEQCLEADCSQ